MLRKTIYSFLILSLLILFGACREDDLMWGNGTTNGELPVEFNFQWPGISETRGFDDANVKTKFTDGDLIHIVGTFTTEELQADGSKVEGITARYGALRYNGETRQWEPAAGNELTWPSISTKGDFYAYYVSASNGLFTDFNSPITVNLSTVTPESDPLMASPTGYIVYGHAVNLQFNHLCTYLTLENMEPNVASRYFLTMPNVKETESGPTRNFNNAFSLSLTENDGSVNPALRGTPELTFKFLQMPDPDFADMVYISGNTTLHSYQDEEGEEKNVTKVGYFLEPGYYDNFRVLYPASAPSYYEYLTYNYNDIPDNVGGIDYENTPPQLEAGRTYTLNITRSPGVKIVNPPPADGWDDEGVSVDVDPKKFLESVRNGSEYKNDDGTVILEQTAEGTRLRYNVNFNNFTYQQFLDLGFLPDLLEGREFDGDHHYISNIDCPLLRNNYGTIKNLGIKNVKYSAVSQEEAPSINETDNINDRSRHGALCMWNRSNAVVNNVKIENVDISITVQYDNPDPDGNEVHNMGCVVGSNTGTINELSLGGEFKLSVYGEDVHNAEVLIGGIIGQNAGNGTLSDVSLYDDNFSLTITNYCQGQLGLYAQGGIVGKSSGYITGVIMSDVTIDSTHSSGVVSYIGGMAGRLDVSDTSTGYIRNCIIGGKVSAGTTKPSNSIKGQSYIGGMVGYDTNVEVSDCRASVSVIGATSVSDNVIYGTGGAFGRIQNPATFVNLIAYGPQLKAPPGTQNTDGGDYANYVGNFAGIGPVGQSWNQDYADKNIILHSFNDLPNIGAHID